MDAKHSAVNFVYFLLTLSDGFRLALSATQSMQYNVTQFVGTTAVIPCVDAYNNAYNNPSWVKNPLRSIVYDASNANIADSTKYQVWNGSNTLAVMNLQLSDATSYCCVIGVNDYCANVVVIDSLVASVYPSTGVNVGDQLNLTCTLIYNAPPRDVNSAFPLSDNQDPRLQLYIGQNEIMSALGNLVIGTDTLPDLKSLSYNRIVTTADVDMNLTCVVTASYPPMMNSTSTPMNVYSATKMAKIKYPNGTRSPDDVYPINSVFTCIGDGYPPPTVAWLDGNTRNMIGPEMLRSVPWTATAQGTYNLICSAKNTLATNTTYNATRVIIGQYGAAPTKLAEIKYPNDTKSLDNFYPINSVFTCIGDGYPPPTVAWIDGNTNSVIGQQRQRSVSWTATAPGAYNLTCSAKNTLATNTTYNATHFMIYEEVKPTGVSSGPKIFLPILLTICCELFIACVIF